MTEILSVAQMRTNVALSEGHVVKQTRIIDRLTMQGHQAMADQAAAILVTMKGHLENEVAMLARMEGRTR